MSFRASSCESFGCYSERELGCEFATLPSSDQGSTVRNWIFDLGDLHPTGELVDELLSDSAINVRQLVGDAMPLHRSEPYWKREIITTTTTLDVQSELATGCTLRRWWLCLWER
jgi:hypothetical protein